MQDNDTKALKWMEKYLRFVDYIAAAQLYLKENFDLQKPLKPEHFKARILGHWGTVPGLNFIYANMNYLIYKHKLNMLFVTGPGHGAPAILANLYAEKTLNDFYKLFPHNSKGFGKIIRDFSWPHTLFPSHVTPTVPGSILEGGELGYSLSTAYGAVLDNPDLIVAAVVGDGEAETGAIATAWHSNKFLNPKTSGAVLPIVHINGYKINNPTLFGTMDNKELTALFTGYGYEPFIVEEPNVEKNMMEACEKAYQMIREVQKKARSSKITPLKPKWPVILLRTEKGWKGIHKYHGRLVEGSFRAHGIPIDHPSKDKDALLTVEKWLQSYNINELLDKNGVPKKEVLEFVPTGKYRMGMNKNAIGGNIYKKLSIPSLSKYSVKVDPKKRGVLFGSSMGQAGKMYRDIITSNKKSFRMFCPDELESNKLEAIFEKTTRAYMWPIEKGAEHVSPDSRAMEMLSEHTLQGWYQGYLLTGRQGVFVSYEAFTTIISSMVDQYAKFLKQSLKVKWRKPIASAIYINSSLGWRQDHNGFSHQNPSFVSNILQKHGEFCQIYYPPDVNSMLVAIEETSRKKNYICVIVAGKRELNQYLTLEEARAQAKVGIGIWEWVGGKEATSNPDVVLASAGDYLTQEAICATNLCKELVPELKIRYVNVSELTALGLGDNAETQKRNESKVNKYLTHDKPVIFNYHGYTNDIEQILWPYTNSNRFIIHGYQERGSTTTPFDLKIQIQVSRYHLAIDMIEQGAKTNKKVAAKKSKVLRQLHKKIEAHQKYIIKFGDDPAELK